MMRQETQRPQCVFISFSFFILFGIHCNVLGVLEVVVLILSFLILLPFLEPLILEVWLEAQNLGIKNFFF